MHGSWLARSSVAWGRSSPLRRAVDRAEHGARVLALALAVLAVPIAVLAGVMVRQAADEIAVRENAAAQPATAILLHDASSDPQDAMLGVTTTLGEWHTATGIVRTGPVTAPTGAAAGATVQIWLDDTGRPVAPPLTADQAYWRGVLTVIMVLLGSFTLIATGYGFVHWLLDRRRFAEWTAQWRAVEPRWTHRD